MDANAVMVSRAQALDESAFNPLIRKPKYIVETESRTKPDNVMSNWAYMVIASLAWNLKAWFAMMVRFRDRRDLLLRMEFRCFLHPMILLPVQIVRQGRKIIYRLLGYNLWIKDYLSAWELIRRTKFT